MDLCIGILTYNSSKTILKCLTSLSGQNNKNFEVIIVDDKSTDNTIDLIKQFSKTALFKIKILFSGKKNFSASRNIVLRSSKSKYIAFIDSDAYAKNNWVENIYQFFAKNKDCLLGGGAEEPVYTNIFSKSIALNDSAISKITGDFWKLKGCNFFINRELNNDVFFNENFLYNDESEFISRLEKKGKWMRANKAVVRHESRSTPKKYSIQMFKCGYWRLLFSIKSKKFRVTDFIPSIILVSTLIGSLFYPVLILTIPAISVMSAILSKITFPNNKSPFSYVLLAWMIKYVFWSLGMIKAIVNTILTKGGTVRQLSVNV